MLKSSSLWKVENLCSRGKQSETGDRRSWRAVRPGGGDRRSGVWGGEDAGNGESVTPRSVRRGVLGAMKCTVGG